MMLAMLKPTKYILPIAAIVLLCVLSTGCSKEELVDCPGHEEPSYRSMENSGQEEGNGMGGISDGGDEESDSERSHSKDN